MKAIPAAHPAARKTTANNIRKEKIVFMARAYHEAGLFISAQYRSPLPTTIEEPSPWITPANN
jgi:hypothetical protein